MAEENPIFKLKNRVTLYRRYKRLVSSLNSLLEFRVIDENHYREQRRKLDDIYSGAKDSLRQSRPVLKRGRPSLPDPRASSEKCRKEGCERPPAPGQVYCTRDHAPFGRYGMGA